MSERLPHKHEHEKQPNSPERSSEQREKLRELIEAAERAENKLEHSIEAIRHDVEHEARGKKETAIGQDHEKSHIGHGHVINREVKKAAYDKELRKIQRHLPKQERAFSSFIHHPKVEAISEAGGKTIARPSGLLVGGMVAFLGSLCLVILSKYYGFTYNFFVFILLLVAGFLLGVLGELGLKTIHKKR